MSHLEGADLATPGPPWPINDVNARIDRCLREALIYERILWSVLALLILVGLSILGYGVFQHDRILMAVSTGETGLTFWPIRNLIQLHRRRIALSVIPAITSLLSPRDAAREIHSLVEHLLGKR